MGKKQKGQGEGRVTQSDIKEVSRDQIFYWGAMIILEKNEKGH